MAFELVYTSVPKGLKAGIRGFCTVAFTEGMPANYVQLAESLSAYKNVYQPNDPQYENSPTAYTHYRFLVGGQRLNVLSRVAPYGTDYSGRTNKLAHHILARGGELPKNGPASLMSQEGFFLTDWRGQPGLTPTQKVLPASGPEAFAAPTWERLTGDAGWAGVLAQSYIDAPQQPAFIVFEPGISVLPLLAEAIALLPAMQRWDVTFNTYTTSVPQGSDCWCRCCLPDSPILLDASRNPGALVINLTDISLSRGPNPASCTSPLLVCARSGQEPVWQPTEVHQARSQDYLAAPPQQPARPTPTDFRRQGILNREQKAPRIVTESPQIAHPGSSGFLPRTKKKLEIPLLASLAFLCVIPAALILLVGIFIIRRPGSLQEDAATTGTGTEATRDSSPSDDEPVSQAQEPKGTDLGKTLRGILKAAREAETVKDDATDIAEDGNLSKAKKRCEEANDILSGATSHYNEFRKDLGERGDSDLVAHMSGTMAEIENLLKKVDIDLRKMEEMLDADVTGETPPPPQTEVAESQPSTTPRLILMLEPGRHEIDISEIENVDDETIFFFDHSGRRIDLVFQEKEDSLEKRVVRSYLHLDGNPLGRVRGKKLILQDENLGAVCVRTKRQTSQMVCLHTIEAVIPQAKLNGDSFRIIGAPELLCEDPDNQLLECSIRVEGNPKFYTATFSTKKLDGHIELYLKLSKADVGEAKNNAADAAIQVEKKNDGWSSRSFLNEAHQKLRKWQDKQSHLKARDRERLKVDLRSFLEAAEKTADGVPTLNVAMDELVMEITREVERELKTVTERVDKLQRQRSKDKDELNSLLNRKTGLQKLLPLKSGNRARSGVWRDILAKDGYRGLRGDCVTDELLCWLVNGNSLDALLNAAEKSKKADATKRILRLRTVKFFDEKGDNQDSPLIILNSEHVK